MVGFVLSRDITPPPLVAFAAVVQRWQNARFLLLHLPLGCMDLSMHADGRLGDFGMSEIRLAGWPGLDGFRAISISGSVSACWTCRLPDLALLGWKAYWGGGGGGFRALSVIYLSLLCLCAT